MSTSRADRPRLVITSGEPAGIGPELCAQLANVTLPPCEISCLVDRELLETRAPAGARLDHLKVLHRPLTTPAVAGKLDVRNSAYVLRLLDDALAGVRNGEFDAMVTAPVQKSVIAESGVAFSGHTEYLAQRCGASKPVMLLVAGKLRVALATTHLPLRRVPDAIKAPMLLEILRIMHHDLQNAFGIAQPRIAVCGLNPHAGENGLLGDEDLREIAPAIAAARASGINAYGPVPADTAFVPPEMAKADAYLAMFHDQGLPVLKHAGFGHAVNVTLGLPLIRTSVDHGTALTLAGSGRADVGSLLAAVELAVELVQRRRTAAH
ncbi:MAG: 4-hydroxythreonine-4-phosphate dehydrogenase PdxA [Gammaproteobacteria bacterium]|jgi:4-hydroxythreonine-4-phosphate dehydrogenase|nr:4-hydroxythreonine-4-phosphate dehydrogenase PdxA [Gammaproteobacteria bacterium]